MADIFADGPPRPEGTEGEQINQLWAYLNRLADRVNSGWLVKDMDIFADKPTALYGDTPAQVRQLYSYLCGLVDFLNMLEIPPAGTTPEGRLYIKDTAVHDVSEYAETVVQDEDLIPENIRRDVEILGVVGTLSSEHSNVDIDLIYTFGGLIIVTPFTITITGQELAGSVVMDPFTVVDVYAHKEFGSYTIPTTEALEETTALTGFTMTVEA